MPHGRDSDSRVIAEHLQFTVWALRRYGERQSGLTPLPQSELEVLRTIGDNPGCTVSEVARLLQLQPSNVSTTVRHLMDRGLVVRAVNPDDRRSAQLHLSETAKRHKQMITDAWVTALQQQLVTMTDHEVSVLVEAAPLLRRLTAIADTP
jgi:DNA-binding MarR family transcriptional regulator